MSPHWYADHATLCAFARTLAERHDWDAEDVLDFFEKPWKWEDEFGLEPKEAVQP